MTLNPKNGIAVYTDGSCYYKDRVGGWAWVALDDFGNSEQAAGSVLDTTNNRMEMTAAIEALRTLSQAYDPKIFLIRSDSEYLVLGSLDPTRSRTNNTDLWDKLDNFASRYNISWEHIYGHRTDFWNNLADKLAGEVRKKATQNGKTSY